MPAVYRAYLCIPVYLVLLLGVDDTSTQQSSLTYSTRTVLVVSAVEFTTSAENIVKVNKLDVNGDQETFGKLNGDYETSEKINSAQEISRKINGD